MAQEIERKFLIDSEKLGPLDGGTHIRQGYIPTVERTAVRVRIADEDAYLTLKGERTGAARSEFEYAIPKADAEQMLSQLCGGTFIDKTRYTVVHAGHKWEIDWFHGKNEGLVVAEIELESEDEEFEMPDWVTEEVTEDNRYYNSNLLSNPYKKWPEQQ